MSVHANMPLRFQSIADQVLEHVHALRGVKGMSPLALDRSYHGRSPRHHCRSQELDISQTCDTDASDQVSACFLHDTQALGARRHGKLEHQVESTQKRGVDPNGTYLGVPALAAGRKCLKVKRGG